MSDRPRSLLSGARARVPRPACAGGTPVPTPVRALARACVLLATSLALFAPVARADVFGPISLVSVGSVGGGRMQQAEYAHDAAISGDGRFVAFDGSVGGQTGVWRRDLATGAIERVAGGDATLPSVSENGRYISFTSTEDLVPEDGARGPNVWVRDMEPGAGEPEYVLASAVNGSTQALAYEWTNPSEEEATRGAVATGRSAISANGQEVAFVTTAVSNLAGAQTPALQVAVRYLASEQTLLVSGRYGAASGQTTDEPVSGEGQGAVYAGVAAKVGFGPTPADASWASNPPPGASISADGSTVAWMGANVSEQAPMLPDETTPALYTEPLWRRIAPGSQTSTERVTGGSDPGSPACVASGESVLPPRTAQSLADPCQGPFEAETESSGGQSVGIWTEANAGEADFVPRLSADGEAVAFVSSAQPVTLGLGFGGEFGEPADLYVASMRTGLTRVQALTPITQVGGANVAADATITDFAISGDGEQVAFTTRRTQFALGSPAYVSAPAAEPGESELFEADLSDDTITWASHGYAGEPSEQTHGSLLQCPEEEDPYCQPLTIGAQSPSLTTDGGLIAFSSTASNLVFGDGNSSRNPTGRPEGELDGSDAFLIERKIFSPTPTPQEISAAPAVPLQPSWQLGVTTRSRANGTVTVYAAVPGAGSLRAGAQGAVVTKAKSKNGERARRTVATRTVASRSSNPKAAGLQSLTLTLVSRYRALASARGGFSATLTVTFAAPHHATLRERLLVTFERVVERPSKQARHKPKRKGGKR
jgi:hypothetical protein